MKEKQDPRIPTMYGPAIYRINENTQENRNDNRRLAGPRRTDATRLLRKIETRIVRAASSRDSRRGRRSYRDKRGPNG